MARTIKYWKLLIHAFCILLIGKTINESSLNYAPLVKVERFMPDLKHILIWSSMHGVTVEGQRHFIKKKCNKINCYFTRNRSLFGDVRYFDAIVFNLQDLNHDRPQVRGLNQKYIFTANDSADNYPVCDTAYDGFFNWTWTYKSDSELPSRSPSPVPKKISSKTCNEGSSKTRWYESDQERCALTPSRLSKQKRKSESTDEPSPTSKRKSGGARSDSTIKYRFISVFNIHSQELGSHFHWIKHMDPVESSFQSLLTSKSKAAAVFLDNCKTRSNREGFVRSLQRELSNYNLTVDIFGECGINKCKRKYTGSCAWKLKKQYFFLLAMEDSLAEDFVTDVVLPAYHNNAVPIVYGGADYSKFLPPGSYINGLELGVSDLAASMYAIIQDRTLYYDFFKWRNHYSILNSSILDACVLCERLNQPAWLIERSSYSLFRKWWLPDYSERCEAGSWF